MSARLLSPLLLVPAILALAAMTLTGRRRLAAAPALPFLLDAPIEADAEEIADAEVVEAPAPAAGALLLRVHVGETVDPDATMLILDRGEEFDVLRPLPGSTDPGYVGFRIAATALAGKARFWLEVDGSITELIQPELIAT
jgi:hypothetical protein